MFKSLKDAEQVKGMLAQLSSLSDVDAVIWVGGSDHYIRKAVLTGKFGDNGGEATNDRGFGRKGDPCLRQPGRQCQPLV